MTAICDTVEAAASSTTQGRTLPRELALGDGADLIGLDADLDHVGLDGDEVGAIGLEIATELGGEGLGVADPAIHAGLAGGDVERVGLGEREVDEEAVVGQELALLLARSGLHGLISGRGLAHGGPRAGGGRQTW